MKTNRSVHLLSLALLMAGYTAVSAETKPYPKHWGEPPAVQTRDMRPLPGGFGEGSGSLAKWIQHNLDKDVGATAGALNLKAKNLSLKGTAYYLDKGKWLAVNPEKNKTAAIDVPVQFADGIYHITLNAVGEEDGQSSYKVSVNGTEIGNFTCPLSKEAFEEGPAYTATWKNITVNGGDVIKIEAAIASSDGKEYSRARWASLNFEPADEATRAANAKLKSNAPAPVTSGPALVMPRKPDGNGSITISGELKQWHKVSLTLDGPYANELDNHPNPFTDSNLTVTFTHESGSPSYKVPGFFAADGNAAESGATAGTKWRANLAPDKTGIWNYSTSFTRGENAALDGGWLRGWFTIREGEATATGCSTPRWPQPTAIRRRRWQWQGRRLGQDVRSSRR